MKKVTVYSDTNIKEPVITTSTDIYGNRILVLPEEIASKLYKLLNEDKDK